MLRSMFTAVSALNSHQTYLDIIADNLANANTPGYKASRMIFQDQIAQLMRPAAAPSTTLGGQNGVQVGLGAQVGSTLTLFTQGMLQATGRNQDVSIQGNGFLIYRATDGNRYSREGSLTMDAAGYLVNASTGMRVQGWMQPATGVINTTAPITDIQAQLDKTIAQTTANATIAGNLNPTEATGLATVTYNVYDSQGAPHSVQVTFTKSTTTPGTWTWAAANPSTTTGAAAITGGGTLTFGPNGQINPASVTGSISVTPNATTSNAGAFTVALDFANMTQLSTSGSSDVAMTYQDGVMAGRVSDISIENTSGKISLLFSNGMRQSLGQLALANFNNVSGLLRQGHTTFIPSENSGGANIGAAGSNGRGAITSGYLESSNVDMANEFTNMILAQRGFQAQTRMITTSDEILQELVNLKR